MKIPITGRKKALFITDVQESFIIKRNKYIIPNIIKIINNIEYDLIVCSLSYNEKGSLWFKQTGWEEIPKENDIYFEIKENLKGKNFLVVKKLSKSIFKCNESLIDILKENKIKEIHITGYETNDCVFATALESFDLGFYTFVIEEACETRTTGENHIKAIELLSYINLTNNSSFEGKQKINFRYI